MNRKNLDIAIAEANRFLKRAVELKAEDPGGTNEYFFDSSKQSGAVKRSSMDLTRALADLRKPG